MKSVPCGGDDGHDKQSEGINHTRKVVGVNSSKYDARGRRYIP